jgi:hypothetical protein
MMGYIISMFIDDELGIDDKIDFVERVHGDKAFMDESIHLLRQEKLVRSEIVNHVPLVEFKVRKNVLRSILRPLGRLAPAMAAAIVVLFFFLYGPPEVSTSIHYRFVIYQPDVNQVALAGSFTEWRMIPMNRTGSGEYWEITLDITKGEHRFTYILDGHQRIADPTILIREQDDFGGENSILLVKV